MKRLLLTPKRIIMLHNPCNRILLGVDYGEKRIGLAWAFPPLFISLPIGYIHAGKTLEESANTLYTLIQEKNISHVILGNPVPMQQGKASPLQKDIQQLAHLLEEKGTQRVILWDERLSSAQAERLLKNDLGFSRKKRKGKTDSIAATLILSSFLEYSSLD